MKILDDIKFAFNAVGITIFDKVFEIIADFFAHFGVK